MSSQFIQPWKVSSIPGGIQMSHRQRYDHILIEDIVLERSPLAIAKDEREASFDYSRHAPRRRK